MMSGAIQSLLFYCCQIKHSDPKQLREAFLWFALPCHDRWGKPGQKLRPVLKQRLEVNAATGLLSEV